MSSQKSIATLSLCLFTEVWTGAETSGHACTNPAYRPETGSIRPFAKWQYSYHPYLAPNISVERAQSVHNSLAAFDNKMRKHIWYPDDKETSGGLGGGPSFKGWTKDAPVQFSRWCESLKQSVKAETDNLRDRCLVNCLEIDTDRSRLYTEMCRAGLSEADGIVITNRNINKGHLKFAIYPNRKFDGPSIMRLVQSADELSQKIKEHRSSNNNNQVSQEDIMTAMCREGHNFVTIDDCWIDSHIPGTRRIFRADLAPPPGPMPVEDVEFLAQLLARTNLSE